MESQLLHGETATLKLTHAVDCFMESHLLHGETATLT